MKGGISQLLDSTDMKKKTRKKIIWFLGIALAIYLAPKLIFISGVDYGETFSTKYLRNDSTKIISTSHFQIVTPKDWIHIFHCYGDEGEAVGSFVTRNGLIRYEYGMFSNPFEIDSIFVFVNDTMTANRFWINIGYNEDNETGIHIPRQNEMEWPFSIFMSKACSKNKSQLIYGIKQIEFKKFYNITWETEE